MNGYIRLHRKISEWEWSTEPYTVALFVYLLTHASFCEHSWKGVTLKPGQLITGREKIAAQSGIPVQRVRTILNQLKSTNEITIESTNQYSIITIVNWDKYQCSDDGSTSESTAEPTSNQPATNQQLTSNQPQYNKGNKGNKGNNVERARARERFETFWKAYPKKVARIPALKAWDKLEVDDTLLKTILDALEKQKKLTQWTKDDGDYVPNPATWLNAHRWDDKIEKTNLPEQQSMPLNTTYAKYENWDRERK